MVVSKKRTKRRRRASRRPKRGLYPSKKGGLIKYRSSWELQYAQWLDESLEVVSFEYEKLVIEYVSNARSGRKRRYFPDFVVTYVDGRKDVIEIKPARRVHQTRNEKKALAAGDWCRANGMLYRILTEVELKELGLLKR